MSQRNILELIKTWFDEGKNDGATHLIIILDLMNYEYSPIYVRAPELIRKRVLEYQRSKETQVIQVYNLRLDKETQFRQPRTMNF